MSLKNDSLAVFIAACLGGFCRYHLGRLPFAILGFPVATILVNWLGTFALVWFVKGYLTQKAISKRLLLALGTGFCGAFTTFSSSVLEILILLEKGRFLAVALYLFLTVFGGLLVASLAYYLAEKGRA